MDHHRKIQSLSRRSARLAIAAVVVCAAGAVAANAAVGSRKAQAVSTVYMIGFTQQQAFWQSVQKGAQAAGDAFGVKVVYAAPAGTGSDADMIPLIQSAIAAKPAGIAIEYAGADMHDITMAALKATPHVVLFNNDRFEGTSSQPATTEPAIRALPYVGQNEDTSGAVIANAFLKYLPKKGTVLVVNPHPGSVVIALRQHAVLQTFKRAGLSSHVILESADPAQDQQITGAYLAAHPDTAGVISLNVNGIDPAVQYITQHGLKIPVAGFDINDVVFNDLRNGDPLKILLDQQPYLQGYMTVENLALELRGFSGTNVNTGTLIIDKQNSGRIATLIQNGLD